MCTHSRLSLFIVHVQSFVFACICVCDCVFVCVCAYCNGRELIEWLLALVRINQRPRSCECNVNVNMSVLIKLFDVRLMDAERSRERELYGQFSTIPSLAIRVHCIHNGICNCTTIYVSIAATDLNMLSYTNRDQWTGKQLIGPRRLLTAENNPESLSVIDLCISSTCSYYTLSDSHCKKTLQKNRTNLRV